MIHNLGASALTIEGSSFRVLDAGTRQVSPLFTLLGPGGQPFPQNDLLLIAGAFQSLAILFRPTTAGVHAARIEITSTDRAVPPVTVPISGEGVG